MINNICDGNKLATTTNAARKAAASNTVVAADKTDDVVTSVANGLVQTTYENGIWYSEIIDKANRTNNMKSCIGNSSNNNNKGNIWLPNRINIVKELQQNPQHYTTNNTHTNNNECDVIIVDMENDEEMEDEKQTITTYTPKYYMEPNMRFCRKLPPTSTVPLRENINSKHIATKGGNIITNKTDVIYHDKNDNVHLKLVNENNAVEKDDDDDNDDDDDDSLASMETLSDNVSIWIDGEKHWVAGVDANTTCSDLIWALLNYQNIQQPTQQMQQQWPQQQSKQQENITATVTNKTNSNQQVQLPNQPHQLQQQHQQQKLKLYDKHDVELDFKSITNQMNNGTLCTGNKPNLNQNNVNTITNTNHCNKTNYTTSCTTAITTATTTATTTTTAINQSMPINTKENCKIIPNSTPTVSAKISPLTSSPNATSMSSSSTLLPLTLPPGITTVSQLATEYVIVKQYHHCEEYLDGSTKVFDVLPPRHDSFKKECELMLRHLGPAPAIYTNNTTPQLSSLISTDKDSGMGSPVGSARSAKFRRRKHKSSQWLSQANTLHPKLSRCMANERLMKIILAQDETIQRQLSLLREKERQITKIEEEKHRKRERELGKNYLLETYLNGLDEAECEPEVQDGEEIFVDEPYHRETTTTTLRTTQLTAIPGTAITTESTAAEDALAVGVAAQPVHMIAKYKPKEKETKKEKKKKRHKEKLTTKVEGLHTIKDCNGRTNKSNDKEKVDQQRDGELNGCGKDTVGNEQEIEMQILWLEKIYTLNKQLQKEEELAAKLHAKVRKHQLRKAQQTQKEVQMEIDKLDNNLALQCGDIRKVEANIMQTNEQLQKKLLVLERLSIEYLQQQQEHDQLLEDTKQQDAIKETHKTEMLSKEQKQQEQQKENPLKNENNNILTSLEKSLDIQKLSLNNINSTEEVQKLQKIIAKPGIDLHKNETELKETKHTHLVALNTPVHNPHSSAATTVARNYSSVFKTSHNQILSNEYTNRLNEMRANSVNDTLNSTNCNAIIAATGDNLQQTVSNLQLLTPSTTTGVTSTDNATTMLTNSTSLAGTTTATKTETLPTSSMCIDKNMLSSLRVQNVKTIKKQMFHTQTTAAAQYKTAMPALTTASAAASALSKQQFQHIIPPQNIPTTASAYLTSRPQNSHQIPASLPAVSNIVLLQSVSSLPTSSPISQSSTLIASQPPLSTSPSLSIMAMNTVDISQLGTLV